LESEKLKAKELTKEICVDWSKYCDNEDFKTKPYLHPLEKRPYVEQMTYDEWQWQKKQKHLYSCN